MDRRKMLAACLATCTGLRHAAASSAEEKPKRRNKGPGPPGPKRAEQAIAEHNVARAGFRQGVVELWKAKADLQEAIRGFDEAYLEFVYVDEVHDVVHARVVAISKDVSREAGKIRTEGIALRISLSELRCAAAGLPCAISKLAKAYEIGKALSFLLGLGVGIGIGSAAGGGSSFITGGGGGLTSVGVW